MIPSVRDLFAQTYTEARAKFLDGACAALDVQCHLHPLPGRDGETLAMDVARFGAADAQRLLIVSSACHGVEGFCYWHYWFAGRRILERPFNEVLTLKEPDFPFCLAWANQTWTGIWHGLRDRVLIAQTYPGRADYVAHFHAIYAGDDASIAIDSLEVLAGSLPDRALRLAREWADLHRSELEDDWQRAREGQPLEPIAPLP